MGSSSMCIFYICHLHIMLPGYPTYEASTSLFQKTPRNRYTMTAITPRIPCTRLCHNGRQCQVSAALSSRRFLNMLPSVIMTPFLMCFSYITAEVSLLSCRLRIRQVTPSSQPLVSQFSPPPSPASSFALPTPFSPSVSSSGPTYGHG